MPFVDRHDAGRQLAERLMPLKDHHPVVLALPRGGVPVGSEIARALAAPLGLALVRKIGAPQHEELAIGAIVDDEPPELVTLPDLIAQLEITPDYLAQAQTVALQEIARRRAVYWGDRQPVEIAGRTVIVVDDGAATGATMLAALRATRRRMPARLVLALPVAPRLTLMHLRREADETVCLCTPEDFHAVGQFYREFEQLQDTDVIALLNKARVSPPFTQT